MKKKGNRGGRKRGERGGKGEKIVNNGESRGYKTGETRGRSARKKRKDNKDTAPGIYHWSRKRARTGKTLTTNSIVSALPRKSSPPPNP